MHSRVNLFVVALLFSSAGFLSSQPEGIPLTVEKIYAHGSLAGNPPSGLAWSPDSKHLTYLEDGELMDLDPGAGKSQVLVSRGKLSSLAGSSANEQDRDHRDRYKMASYLWAPDSKHLLFDSNGSLWLYDLGNGTGVQVGLSDAASGSDPKFSPNGSNVSFIRAHGLSVVQPRSIGNPTPYPVAPSPNGTDILNGQVDWVYEEELDVRSNYFWSPDSKNLAFLQMNETNVPQYPIVDWIPTHAAVEMQRYPQPGDSNPEVRIGVVGTSGGHVNWVKLPSRGSLEYVPRFGWVDRHTLWVETLSRDHKQRSIFFADISSNQSRLVCEIDDEKFLPEEYDTYVGDGSIVLTSWKDGHDHIYLYPYDPGNPMAASSASPRQLTKGDFEVTALSFVDFRSKAVYFASNEGSPLDQQLWKVSFDGERKQITTEPGFHEGNYSPNGEFFVDKFSTRTTAPNLSLCKTGGACKVFWSTSALDPYKLREPAVVQEKAHDGSLLYATLLLPESKSSAAGVPVIVNPYGGPGPEETQNKWTDSLLFDELLVQHGFAVLHTDNRGSGRRSRDFAQASYRNFGPVQLEDQLTMLDAVLDKYPQLDRKRLGWWGWSWGGTFTLYALTHSDRFAAGVSVAPVTDWRNYDSIYTERYLGVPTEFAEGYKNFSVVNSAAKMKGHLLLVHGTGDDNVHIENSVQFIQNLIEAGLPYDLQIYPRKTHSIAGPDVRTHLFNRILAHFEEYLKPANNTGQEK